MCAILAGKIYNASNKFARFHAYMYQSKNRGSIILQLSVSASILLQLSGNESYTQHQRAGTPQPFATHLSNGERRGRVSYQRIVAV